MIQLLLHLIGDYLLQNDYVAQNKTKYTIVGWMTCLIHCILYSLPFLLITDIKNVMLIFACHFLIDKFRLAVYWIKAVNWNWDSKNFGYADDKPLWMSVWLLIIVDNTLHLITNYLILNNGI